MIPRPFHVACAAFLILSGCASTPPKTPDNALAATLREVAESAEKSYDYESAAGSFNQLYENDPNDISALIGMARNLRYAGIPREGIKDLRQGIAKHGDRPALLLELGKAQLAAALTADARETLERLVALTPDSWQAYAALALVYDRLGRYDDAQRRYRLALQLSPGNIAVSNNLALSLAQSGKLKDGIALLSKIAESENSTVQVRQNLALLTAFNQDFRLAERIAREDLVPEDVAKNMDAYRSLAGLMTPEATPTRPLAQGSGDGATVSDDFTPKGDSGPEQATIATDIYGTYEAVVDTAIRERPSAQSTVVALLKQGHTTKVLGRAMNDSWYLVMLESGTMGFIDQNVVKPVDPPPDR